MGPMGPFVYKSGNQDGGGQLTYRLPYAVSELKITGIEIPGDLSGSSEYFTTDICEPKFSTQDGLIYLNPPKHASGLGCVLNYENLNKVLVEKKVFKR